MIFLSQASQATLSLQRSRKARGITTARAPYLGNHSGGTEPPGEVRREEGEEKVSALGHRPGTEHVCKVQPATTTHGQDLTVSRVCRPAPPRLARGNLSDSESCIQGWPFASGSRDRVALNFARNAMHCSI